MVAAFVLLAADVAWAEPGFSPVEQLPVPVGASPQSTGYNSISCPSQTACTAVAETGAGAPYVVAESAVGWASPEAITLPSKGDTGSLAVTCASVGDCLAAGSYTTPTGMVVPLHVEESSDSWGAAVPLAPPAGGLTGPSERALLLRPWCTSAGNCEAIGVYETSHSWALMSATETAGTWGQSASIPSDGVDGGVPGIGANGALASGLAFSCSAPGDCVAVSDTATWSESAGSWSNSTALPAPTPMYAGTAIFQVTDVACTQAPTCIAVGDIYYSWCSCRPVWIAAAATEASGTWAAPENEEGSLSDFTAVSCESGGCVAVGDTGSYDDFDTYWLPLAVTWSDGTWSGAVTEPIPLAGSPHTEAAWLNAVSCAAATQCVAVGEGGEYQSGNGPIPAAPFATAITPVSTALMPGPVTNVVATPQRNGASVSWTSPTDDGGAPISSYTAWVIETEGNVQVSCTVTATSCTLPDLANGRQYVVAVTDNNGTIGSALAHSNHFFAGAVPSAPTDVQASAPAHGVTVTWRPASSPQGESILRYRVDVTSGRRAMSCIAKATDDSCTLRSAVKGRRYRISVSALDVNGWSRAAVIVVVPRRSMSEAAL